MAGPEQADKGAVPFAWGKKRGRGGKEMNVQFYASFTYDGVEYSLYDSVYLYKEGEPEPFIGKLIKMWEQPGNRKRVKILWLFRPVEIRNFLGEHEKPLKNEIFLACGQGHGVSDVNPLESIAGKCNVICTSKDPRNRQPSDEELKLADYIFHRTFDVGSCTISDEIGETIDGVKAKYIFNFDEESTHQRSGMNGASKNPSPAADIVPEKIRSIEQEIGAELENSGPLDAENDSSSKKIKLLDTSRKRKSSVGTDVTEENMTSKLEIEFSSLKSGKLKSSLSTPDVSLQEIESEIGAEVANYGPLDAPNDPCSKKMKLPDASRKQKSSKGTDVTEEKMISKPESEFSSLKSGKSKPSLSTPDVSLQKIEPEICAEAVNSGPTDAPNDSSSKKMKLPDASRKQKSGKGTDITEEKMISKPESEFSSLKSGKTKPTPDVSSQKRQNFNEIEQVPRRPGAETSKWFTGLPWETRIQEAREQGTLLLVENFDLVHTSEEIEDLIYHFFKKQCTARVIEFSMFSSPFHGRALVICKSKGDAEEIVKRLKENVLMLSNGRPLIARMMLNQRPLADSKFGKFYGHYVAEKTRRRSQREEMRNAVSTSHCSQPNTLEFEMAVDWMLLHEKSAGWWRELHEEHEKEVKKLRLDRPAAAKKRA